ncbi:MAG: hypothetical protein JNL74_24035 [Fibrobacteres bacterium]|nr:hypothetical protein [Fibrobacterota bacterium]
MKTILVLLAIYTSCNCLENVKDIENKIIELERTSDSVKNINAKVPQEIKNEYFNPKDSLQPNFLIKSEYHRNARVISKLENDIETYQRRLEYISANPIDFKYPIVLSNEPLTEIISNNEIRFKKTGKNLKIAGGLLLAGSIVGVVSNVIVVYKKPPIGGVVGINVLALGLTIGGFCKLIGSGQHLENGPTVR